LGVRPGRIANLTRKKSEARQSLPHVTAIVEQPAKIQRPKCEGPQYSSHLQQRQTSHPADNRYDHNPKFSRSNFFSSTKRYLRILSDQQYNCLSGRAGRKSATARGNENRAKKPTSTPRTTPRNHKNDTHDILQTYDHEFTSLIVARSMLPRESRVFLRFSN
jgi:hypothetical protein